MTNGTGANDGANRKPGQISFGGDNRGNHTRSKCRIAEFIVINRVVPEAERLKIEGYLTRKWGFMSTMFTAAHPYYSSDPYQPTVTQGGEDAAVTFYWGDNNGSTTAGNGTIIMQYLALMEWAWYLTRSLWSHYRNHLLLHRQGCNFSRYLVGTCANLRTGQYRP